MLSELAVASCSTVITLYCDKIIVYNSNKKILRLVMLYYTFIVVAARLRDEVRTTPVLCGQTTPFPVLSVGGGLAVLAAPKFFKCKIVKATMLRNRIV